MATLTDLDRFITANRQSCDFGSPASEELIARAERFLNIKFPSDYREFLKRWGTLAIGPMEFYGITGEEFESSSVPNAIWYTKIKREQLGLPKEFIILYDNNGSEYYCLDTSNESTSRVLVWDVPRQRVRGVKAESLFEFILTEGTEVIV